LLVLKNYSGTFKEDYWYIRIFEYVISLLSPPLKLWPSVWTGHQLSVTDLSKMTSILIEDTAATLQMLGLIQLVSTYTMMKFTS
jgi:hypothetical protein